MVVSLAIGYKQTGPIGISVPESHIMSDVFRLNRLNVYKLTIARRS